MEVRLVSVTKPEAIIEGQEVTPEGLMAYCARVSSPHQEKSSYAELLSYCVKYGHWSVFEMVDMTLEIITSRSISAQILRHRSFSFQEFSQRYAKATEVEIYSARRQDVKNRQNSIDDLPEEKKRWFKEAQESVQEMSFSLYQEALDKGIAKECARVLLPLSTKTKLYMKGSVRSWIHYIELRSSNGTQEEHRCIALEAKRIFVNCFPSVGKALNWLKEEA